MFSLATWVTLFQRAVMQGVPLLFGATGELLTEKSGNLNLDPVDLHTLWLPADGVAVLFLDRDPAGQPECNRFGHHHLWRWIR